MRRGDVYWVDLEPTAGSEADKTRPAVVVSNDAANRAVERRGGGVLTVVPMSAKVERVFAFQALLTAAETGLSYDSKARAEQVLTVAAERLRGRIGALSRTSMRRLDDALRLHLSL